MSLYKLSKYKYSQNELNDSSVINEQLSQIQYDGWELAGKSEPYRIDRSDKSNCGEWVYYGCKNVSKHKNNLLTNNTNPVFVKPTKYNCNRLRCSECYTRASYERSLKISKRIKHFRKTSGFYNSRSYLKETHVIVSPRVEINDTYESIRSKAVKKLQDVGLVGGVLVVHHYRCEDRKYTKKGLHFHAVGFAHNARVDGLEVKRQFEKENGWIIKNKGSRKSVRKTISYLLSHCSVKEGKHSITWFGKLSYSKMKNPGILDKELKELEKVRCCPMCQERLDRLEYVGLDRPPTELGYGKASDWIIVQKAKKKRKPHQNYKLRGDKVYSSMSGIWS